MPRAPPGGVRGAATAGRPGDRFGPRAGGAVQGAELRKLPGTKSGEEGSGTRHHRDLPTARHSTTTRSLRTGWAAPHVGTNRDTVAAGRAERPSLSATRGAGGVRGSLLNRCWLLRTRCIRATATRSAVHKRLPHWERLAPDTDRGSGRSTRLPEVRILPVRDAEVAEVGIEGSVRDAEVAEVGIKGSAKPMD